MEGIINSVVEDCQETIKGFIAVNREHEMGKILAACPICDSSSISFYFRGESDHIKKRFFDLSICDDCGHYFVNPQPSAQELEEYYSSGYEAYNRYWELTDDQIGSMAQEIVSTGRFPRGMRFNKNMNVLDVGCGGGVFLNVAQRAGANVQGVEPSIHGAKNCWHQGLSVFHGDLEDFKKSRESSQLYDLIRANHVVEHHPDPVRLLQCMASLLAPGGKIWIAVPNAETFFAKALRDKWYSLVLPIHLQQFNPESVREMANRASLEIEKIYTYSLDEVLWTTIRCYLRHRWFVPMRLTRHCGFALPVIRWIGARRDATMRGEEIVLEATIGRR